MAAVETTPDGITIAYLDGRWNPVEPDVATLVKIIYPDGRIAFATKNVSRETSALEGFRESRRVGLDRTEEGHWISYQGQAICVPEGDECEDAVKTDDVEVALKALADGKFVDLRQKAEVSTLLNRLRDIAKDSLAKGFKAPTYDLCKVSVQGTNVFCAEAKGLPRAAMPQLSGKPLSGSPADKLGRDRFGQVDIGPAFLDHLKMQGVKVTEGTERADYLRASQRELNGVKVAAIMDAMRSGGMGEASRSPLFISRDNYIVDGHHRWAAMAGLRYVEGENLQVPVHRVDMGIMQLLGRARKFAAEQGLPSEKISVGLPGKESAIEAFRESLRVPEGLRIVLREYNPDQPRVPAGSSDGGQWMPAWDAGIIADQFARTASNPGKPTKQIKVVQSKTPPGFGEHAISGFDNKHHADRFTKTMQRMGYVAHRWEGYDATTPTPTKNPTVFLAHSHEAMREYSPDQPRVPAGSPDGGQWTVGATSLSAGAERIPLGPHGGPVQGWGARALADPIARASMSQDQLRRAFNDFISHGGQLTIQQQRAFRMANRAYRERRSEARRAFAAARMRVISTANSAELQQRAALAAKWLPEHEHFGDSVAVEGVTNPRAHGVVDEQYNAQKQTWTPPVQAGVPGYRAGNGRVLTENALFYPGSILVARDNENHIIGALNYQLYQSGGRDLHVNYLGSLQTTPGIGTSLMRNAARMAEAQGRSMSLYALEDARPFYRYIGGEEVGGGNFRWSPEKVKQLANGEIPAPRPREAMAPSEDDEFLNALESAWVLEPDDGAFATLPPTREGAAEADVPVDESGKVTKPSVNYVDVWGGPQKCNVCSMFQKPDVCTMVAGTIAPRGHCDEWLPLDTETAQDL